MTHDGLGKYLSQVVKKAPGPTADIVGILRDTKTDVVVNFLPVGSEMATKWYVEQASRPAAASSTPSRSSSPARNTGPSASASAAARDRRRHQEPGRRHHPAPRPDQPVRRPRRAPGPHLPAQLRRQHRLPEYARARALESKKISKTGAVTSMLPYPIPPDDVHVGPSDYVPWLTDRKWCYIRMEGTTFGDVPPSTSRPSWRCGTRPTRPA
jgi:myo-inositol-1-phosphate synthase